VLKEKTDAWHHGVSPPSRQQRLESLTNALRSLADAGLGAALVLANLHHQRIVPLLERELRIYEISDATNPTVLARSRLLHQRLSPEYAAMRARHAISL
jgi:GTP cyclohydrolase II